MRVFTNPKIYSFQPQREKESFEVSSKTISVLFILVLVLGLVYFFLFSSYFKIKNIYIVGAGDYENKVSKIIDEFLSQQSNIFLFSNKDAEKKISEEYPLFSQVRIYKGFPDALKIDLKMREPLLICISSGNEFLIDKEGVAFKGENIPENLPKIENDRLVKSGSKTFSSDFVHFVIELVEDFSAKTNIKITKIVTPESDFVLEIYTEKGWKAIFDTTKSVDKQLNNLALILSQIGDQKIEYIDLRLEDRIYYK